MDSQASTQLGFHSQRLWAVLGVSAPTPHSGLDGHVPTCHSSPRCSLLLPMQSCVLLGSILHLHNGAPALPFTATRLPFSDRGVQDNTQMTVMPSA